MGLNMRQLVERKAKSASLGGPVVTKGFFAECSGLRVDQVRGMISNGYLPTIKIGKHRLINLALLTQECLDAELDI